MVVSTETKETKQVTNLYKVAQKIGVQSRKIRERAKQEEKVEIPVGSLVKKISELEVLPEDAIAVQVVYSEKKDRFYANTLTLFRQDDNTFIVTDAALNSLKALDIEYVKYRLGYNAYQEIKVAGQLIQIDIRTSNKFYATFKQHDGETGEGTPPLDMVRLIPGNAPVPLKALEEEQKYTVVAETGTSEYGSTIYKVEDENEEELHVISNSSLDALLAGKELPFDIQIDGTEEIDQGTIVRVSAAGSTSFDDFDL